MCVGSAMPVATLPVTAHRDRLSDVMNDVMTGCLMS